jgi:hypothetical protein
MNELWKVPLLLLLALVAMPVAILGLVANALDEVLEGILGVMFKVARRIDEY